MNLNDENYWVKLKDNGELEHNIRWKFWGDASENDCKQYPKICMDLIPLLNGGYIALLDHMGTDIDIVNAARKSFNRESNFFDDKDRKLLRYLWENKHTSPFEMVEFKFAVKAPMFVARQWMRHRTWSYNEVSRRYTEDNLHFYVPNQSNIRKQSTSDRQASIDWVDEDGVDQLMGWFGICGNSTMCEEQYYELLKYGVCREQARMVLPQSLYTEFVAKVDLSNLLHFLELRVDKHAQWEIQQYALAIIEMIKNIVPETMDIFEEKINATT